MANGSDTDRRKELDREISSYITGLRKKDKRMLVDFLRKLRGRKKSPKAELHPEVSTYGESEEMHRKSQKMEEEQADEETEKEFEAVAERSSFWQWLKSKFSSKPYEDDMEEAEMPESSEYEEEASEEAPVDEIEEEYIEEVKKQGWFSRLFSKILVKSREEDELEEAADEIAEDVQDMKIIAEISTSVMKMLPPDKLKEFKQSPEFHTFKEILKKRELIK